MTLSVLGNIGEIYLRGCFNSYNFRDSNGYRDNWFFIFREEISLSHEINQIVVIITEYLSRNYFILRATIIPGSGYVPETALKTER